MENVLFGILIGAIVGVWAFLLAGPLSGPDEVFGWLKSALYRCAPMWIYKPVIGCAKCSAFWWATAVVAFRNQAGMYWGIEIVIIAVFAAYILETKL